MSDAARLLGVHANTVRTWTDQGALACLRINDRGDRRYARQEIARFLGQANAEQKAHAANGTNGLLTRSAELAVTTADCKSAIDSVVALLVREKGYEAAALVADDGVVRTVTGSIRADEKLAYRARNRHTVLTTMPRGRDAGYQAAIPFGNGHADGGVIVLAGSNATRTEDEVVVLAAVAAQLDVAVALASQMKNMKRGQKRAELLLSMEDDMSARLEPDAVLERLVENALHAFGAQRGGVFLNAPDGRVETRVARNLSPEFCQVLEHATSRPLTTEAMTTQRAVSATDYGEDARSIELRPAIRREGINSVAVAPLVSQDEAFGVLCLYHDEPHEWPAEDLALLERLARHGAAVMRSAQDYSQMSKWTAQLQSIQQLGSRLTRLRSVAEIGQAICAELVQLIDTHNTRVYRVLDETVEPVAWRGQIGEYQTEDSDQLRLKVGQGITGWVARYGLAQNIPDAAHDERALTIPGTDADLPESLLIAPMLYEDNVLGVIVLAKLGLNQFKSDDLRLLEIYASIAAQAMANADVTERLHAQSEALARQVSSQRELMRVTESILGTLDTQDLLQEIAERLNTLVEVDNTAVLQHDPMTRRLNIIFAKGINADSVRNAHLDENEGVSGLVLRTGEAQLVEDEVNDPRLTDLAERPKRPGAMIIAPLRSAERVQGVLVLERLGVGAHFSQDEFELVKLFAAHVSIALRNAAQHRAVELRAETDRLTGLWNHGALTERLDQLVGKRSRFGMLMVDLDHFKEYNDAYGHQAGNVMLQRVAQQLRESCRDTDLVFRFGGDEFVVILPSTALPGARTVAGKIRTAVAEIAGTQGRVGVTCSVGIATYPRDGADGAQMVLAADRACYAAKRSGRDRIATAADGIAMASEFHPTEPTPVEPEPAFSAA